MELTRLLPVSTVPAVGSALINASPVMVLASGGDGRPVTSRYRNTWYENCGCHTSVPLPARVYVSKNGLPLFCRLVPSARISSDGVIVILVPAGPVTLSCSHPLKSTPMSNT